MGRLSAHEAQIRTHHPQRAASSTSDGAPVGRYDGFNFGPAVSPTICVTARVPALPLRKAASDFLIAHAAGDTDEHTPPRLKPVGALTGKPA